jgi:hypothetical protein
MILFVLCIFHVNVFFVCVCVCVCVLQYWGLNSASCYTSALPLEPHHQPFFVLDILELGSQTVFLDWPQTSNLLLLAPSGTWISRNNQPVACFVMLERFYIAQLAWTCVPKSWNYRCLLLYHSRLVLLGNQERSSTFCSKCPPLIFHTWCVSFLLNYQVLPDNQLKKGFGFQF